VKEKACSVTELDHSVKTGPRRPCSSSGLYRFQGLSHMAHMVDEVPRAVCNGSPAVHHQGSLVRETLTEGACSVKHMWGGNRCATRGP
jgi:hypothetical protein